MITTAELHRAAASEGLRFDQVEKDYVILWLLQALSQSDSVSKAWAFKGGTCLRHCYYAGYRFSEDIDFSCRAETRGLEAAAAAVSAAAATVQSNSGIRMTVKSPQTVPGDFQVEIPVEYTRGGMRTRGLPSMKVHLTFDEPILTTIDLRSVSPRYADVPPFRITTYSKKEIVAEKLRALLQQQKKWPRPRDLYDLWFIVCQSREQFDPGEIKDLFVQKCRARGIEPDLNGVVSENLREWNRAAWQHLLGPMVKALPEFEKVWSEWTRTFKKQFL